jgi:hypothetical protein
MGHALMENRNGLIVGALATRASGHAERLVALHLMEPHADRAGRVTLGADKGYDAQDFVAELREVNVTPHVAQNMSGRRSAIDGRTTHHPGYAVSLRIRKRIEEAFGWAKTVAGLRKARHRGAAEDRLAVHLRDGRLQPRPPTEASATTMTQGHRRTVRPAPSPATHRTAPRREMLPFGQPTSHPTNSFSAAC